MIINNCKIVILISTEESYKNVCSK